MPKKRETSKGLSEFSRQLSLVQKDYDIRQLISKDLEGCVFRAVKKTSLEIVVIKYISRLDEFYNLKRALR